LRIPGVVTDETLVQGDDVTFMSDGAAIRAYLARPSMPGLRPGLIVIHEAFGLNDHIRDISLRLANTGFTVLAPDLYSREGAPALNDRSEVMGKMFAVPDARAVQDLDAAAAYLRAIDGATGKVGCIGFCSGGRQTLLYACSSKHVDAAMPCWGGFISQANLQDATTPERPTPIVDLLPNLSCPLLVVGGIEDQNPSPDQLTELHDRLTSLGKETACVKIFNNAGHAFLADYRPSYREEAAFELWPQIVSFFQKHLS